MNNPEIKWYSVDNKYPDGKKGLDSANIYWLKKGSQPDAKMILDSAKKALKKALPHTIGNQWSTWWD